MCRSEWDFEGEPEEAKDDPAWQRFGDEDSDQFGIRTALFVLALACFFAAVFFMARPNSETSQGAINGVTSLGVDTKCKTALGRNIPMSYPMQITLRYPTETCPGCKRPMTPSPPLAISDDTDLCDVTYTCEDCGATTTRAIKVEKK